MVKNNSINRRIIKSLDKKWKKKSVDREYVATLLGMAHLDGYMEGFRDAFGFLTLKVPFIIGIGMCIGFMYGLMGSYVGVLFNFLIFSTVFLGLQYLVKRKGDKEWD